MADSKLTALSDYDPALEDPIYAVDDPAGTPVSKKLTLTRLGGLLHPARNDFRLTTESGVAVSTSDRTAQGTLYLTPYIGNRIAIYDGTRWRLYSSTQISLALTVTSGSNYDVFVYDNAGTLTLELSAAWTNDTTRADALTTQDGVTVKSGATTRRWLGTIRASGTNTTEDSAGGSTTQVGGKRFVWNAHNQVPRHLAVIDTADSWTYGTASFRAMNNASGNKVEYVSGDAAMLVEADAMLNQDVVSGDDGTVGIGVDSTTVNSSQVRTEGYSASTAEVILSAVARYLGRPGLGYHYLAALEKANAGTVTFLGDDTGFSQSGLVATVWG